MFGEELVNQELAVNLIYIILMCIIIIIVLSIFKFFSRMKEKRKYITMEKNIQLIYEELVKINEKLDQIYNNDSNEFVEK